MKQIKLFIKLTLTASIGLFLMSLTRQSFCTESGCEYSLQDLLIGWAGFNIAWLANPLLIVSWFMLNRRPKSSLLLSIISLSLSVYFLYFSKICNLNDEWTSTITYYKSGYWLWIFSSFSMVIGSTVIVIINKYKSDGTDIKFLYLCIAIIAVCLFTSTGIIVGLYTPKFINIVDQARGQTYEFTGNLDTLDQEYIGDFRRLGLSLCSDYLKNRKTEVGNSILWLYSRYGTHIEQDRDGAAKYPRVDSLVKYRYKIFDVNIPVK